LMSFVGKQGASPLAVTTILAPRLGVAFTACGSHASEALSRSMVHGLCFVTVCCWQGKNTIFVDIYILAPAPRCMVPVEAACQDPKCHSTI